MNLIELSNTLAEAARKSLRLSEIESGAIFTITTNKLTETETTYRLALMNCTGPGHKRTTTTHAKDIAIAIIEGTHCVASYKHERIKIVS
jgi:hypothetical protein